MYTLEEEDNPKNATTKSSHPIFKRLIILKCSLKKGLYFHNIKKSSLIHYPIPNNDLLSFNSCNIT